MAFKKPAEHGAWGILVAPFLSAAAVGASTGPDAGGWNLPLLLCGVCLLALFLLRGSLAGREARTAIREPAHLVLASLVLVTAHVLVLYYGRWQLIGLGHAAGFLYVIQRRLAASNSVERKEKHSLQAELIGVVLLSLSAPAAWISAQGGMSFTGVQVWLLNLLFFLGGVLYVKYRVRGIAAHRQFAGVSDKLAFAWPVVIYHVLMAAFLASSIVQHWFPVAVLLAFVPGILRANALLLHLGRRFAIRRLGWTEVAHSLVFGVLLVLAFR